jgi:hypothetical protein
MKKIKFRFVVGLMLAIALISCSSDSSDKKEEILYCRDYIFRDQVCSNKIDGINVIDTQDCRNLGGKIETAEIYGIGCSNKQINCQVDSYCVSNVKYSVCKANNGSMVSSCSGYPNSGSGQAVCNKGSSCSYIFISSCLMSEGMIVSSCTGYVYCQSTGSGLCTYLKSSSCTGNSWKSVSVSACSSIQ